MGSDRRRRRRWIVLTCWAVFLLGCSTLSLLKLRQNALYRVAGRISVPRMMQMTQAISQQLNLLSHRPGQVGEQLETLLALLAAEQRKSSTDLTAAQFAETLKRHDAEVNQAKAAVAPGVATRSDLERRLNGGKRFVPEISSDGFDAVRHWDRRASVEYRLLFEGQDLVRSEVHTRVQTMPDWWDESEIVRGRVARVGPAIWAGLLLLVLLWRRRAVAQVLLAIAILPALALLLDPSLTWAGWWPQFPAGPELTPGLTMHWSYAAGMLLVSAALVVWSRGSRRQGAAYCRNCEYDLTGNVSGVCPECGTRRPESGRRDAEDAEKTG